MQNHAPSNKVAPGPRPLPVLGNALTFGRDPRLARMQWAKEYGPLVAHAVAHPDAVKHILFDNNDNYQKAPHSMMEATLIVAALLQRYDLHLDLSRPVYTSCSSPELAQ